MGQFMDAWSGLEFQLFLLFKVLVGTDAKTARVLFSTGFPIPTLEDLLNGLAELRATQSERTELETLFKRISKATTKRNRIVHGTWMWEVETLGDKKGGTVSTSVWVRVYSPISPDDEKEIRNKNNQKVRDSFRFPVPKISESSKHINALSEDVAKFTERLALRLYPEGLPE